MRYQLYLILCYISFVAYIPVYIYAYTALMLTPLFAGALIKFVPYSAIPHWAIAVVPSVFYPQVFSDGSESDSLSIKDSSCPANSVIAVPRYHSQDIRMTVGSVLRKTESEGSRSDLGQISISGTDFSERRRYIIKSDRTLSTFMHHISILLTFGMCCPVLSFLICCVILLSAVQWHILLSRFVFLRLKKLGYWGEDHDSSVLAAVSSVIGNRPNYPASEGLTGSVDMKSSGYDVLKLHTLNVLEETLRGGSRVCSYCIWPVVHITCLFYGLLCWDMASDEAGWKYTIWIPIVSACMSPCIFLLRTVISKRSARDAGAMFFIQETLSLNPLSTAVESTRESSPSESALPDCNSKVAGHRMSSIEICGPGGSF